ncbi:uncharacterized protein LOC106644857 [Copidosoma floridanum]|uniref:uncharacterized protein LOC106644857 n=1 Tax=Copidosoma floridanum TaxID=29053 RepID=UPI0006C971C1|nr:uncharacterized protein LOC106644857 [Copidosoma floridanum]
MYSPSNTQLLKLLIYYFKIFGIAPIKAKIMKHNGTVFWTFTDSKCSAFYGVKGFFSGTKFDIVIDVTQDFLLLLTTTIILVTYIVKRKMLVEIGNKINMARQRSDQAKDNNEIFIESERAVDKIVFRLNFLHKSHLFLNEISQDLSSFHSCPMLLSLIEKYLSLVVYAYHFSKPIVLGINDLTTIDLVHCLAYWLLCATELVFLTTSASSVVAESKKTGLIINSLLVSTNDKKIAEKIIQFSMYLSYNDFQDKN